MSASLVGSEMCIRDSCATAARPRRGSCCWATWARTWSSRPRTHQFARGAVSYTHLTLPTICSV
eukprot:6224521-Alexandrium_andersonii.AAC.1